MSRLWDKIRYGREVAQPPDAFDKARDVVLHSVGLAFVLYVGLAGSIFFPYYSFAYAKSHGFVSWFIWGNVVAGVKAAVWPLDMTLRIAASETCTRESGKPDECRPNFPRYVAWRESVLGPEQR